MKTSCEVIRDLLPLYCDGVCSEESREMVREHLKDCETCREELHLMDAKIETAAMQVKEDTAVKAAAAAWKKGKGRAFLKGCLVVLLCFLISKACHYGYHWFSTADADNMDALLKKAAEYGHSSNLTMKKMEQRGSFLVMICSNAVDKWTAYIFERDNVFQDRWYVTSSLAVGKGKITHWNFGIGHETVIVFCGREIPEEVDSYMYYNDGVNHICYIQENDILLDVFVTLDNYDINGHPTLLDENGQVIEIQ